MSRREPYRLRCRFHHEWRILKVPELRFTDKSERFCRACLEERRIEVASIQVEATSSLVRACAWCFSCQRDTFFPLLPDLAPGASYAHEGGELDEGMAHLRWYHLPDVWPRCAHCGEPTADSSMRAGA